MFYFNKQTCLFLCGTSLLALSAHLLYLLIGWFANAIYACDGQFLNKHQLIVILWDAISFMCDVILLSKCFNLFVIQALFKLGIFSNHCSSVCKELM
jgi:hypothetical protein